jgi:hypothetical protein
VTILLNIFSSQRSFQDSAGQYEQESAGVFDQFWFNGWQARAQRERVGHERAQMNRVNSRARIRRES